MNSKNRASASKQGKGNYLVVRWNDADGEIKKLWEELCRDVFGMDMSEGTRECLTEILSCFLTDDKLDSLRLPKNKTYPPPLLYRALTESRKMRANLIDIQRGMLGRNESGQSTT